MSINVTSESPTGASNNKMESSTILIKDVHVGMKNASVTCIVLEVGNAVIVKDKREVRTLKVADQSACINLTVWDEPGQYVNPGDILRLTKVYASVWRNALTLYISKLGSLEKIGEFCMVFNEDLNMSEIPVNPPAGAVASASGNMTTNNTTGGASHNVLETGTSSSTRYTARGSNVNPTTQSGGGSGSGGVGARYEYNKGSHKSGQHNEVSSSDVIDITADESADNVTNDTITRNIRR